jgi:excinuclease ABC subunit B
MQAAMRETDRRRAIQVAYNAEHGITPESVQRSIHEVLQSIYERDYYTVEAHATRETFASAAEVQTRIAELEAQMKDAARRLDFEQAAELRDRVRDLRRHSL